MALPSELRSRKLAGLLITFTAILVLVVVYIVASIWINVSDAVITAATTTLGALGGGHQAAQAAQDRAQAYSPNYPAPAVPPGNPPELR